MGVIKQLEGNQDKAYKFPETEKNLVHAEISPIRNFNEETGKLKSRPFIQKYNVRDWRNFLEHPAGHKVVKVLHLPEGAVTPEEIEKQKAAALAAEKAALKKA